MHDGRVLELEYAQPPMPMVMPCYNSYNGPILDLAFLDMQQRTKDNLYLKCTLEDILVKKNMLKFV